MLNIQSKWTVHKNITALLQLSTYTTGLHRATINNSVEGRRALLPRVSCSFRPKQENAKAVWTSMCVKSQLSLQSLHVWKHIHLTQTLFLEFLSTHYYYCIQTISLRQRRGGRDAWGPSWLPPLKNGTAGGWGGRGSVTSVNSLRTHFSHDGRRHNTGWTLAGIPAGHLNNRVDLLPSMEEVIWKRSSITASILWGPTGEQLKLTKTMVLLSFT